MWLNTENAQKSEILITECLDVSNDTHNIFTPFLLCKEVVNKIPSLDGNILVVANIEFIYTLLQEGVDRTNIYFATHCKEKASVAALLIDTNNCFICTGVLDNEGLRNMKFDVVVGNPPYQKPNSKNTDNLWHTFLKRAFDIIGVNGYVSLIVPNSWATNKKLYTTYFLNKNVIHINLNECAKYFPGVGSTFSYFITQHNKNNSTKTVQLDDDQVVLSQLPTYGLGATDANTLMLLTKLTGTPSQFEYSTSYKYHTDNFSKDNTHFSKIKTNKHHIPVLHKQVKGNKQYFYVDFIDDKQYNQHRVVVNGWVANYKDMIICQDELFCQQYSFFPTSSEVDATRLLQVLQSPIYLFIHKSLSTNKKSHNLTILGNFPKVDLSRSWTDQELYTHFNLTQEEIQLIEDTIK